MLSYKEFGNGYPLLLVHGLGVSFPIWKDIIPVLEKNYRLIVIEHPGVGNSEKLFGSSNFFADAADKIEELRKELKIEEWGIISYSLGARITEKYLEKYSGTVDKNIYLFSLDPEQYKLAALKFIFELDKKWPQVGNFILSEWRLKLLISGIGFNFAPNENSKLWYDELAKVPTNILKNTLKEALKVCTEKLKIDKDTKCIWGQMDTVSDSMFTKRPGYTLSCGHGGIHNKKTLELLQKLLKEN